MTGFTPIKKHFDASAGSAAQWKNHLVNYASTKFQEFFFILAQPFAKTVVLIGKSGTNHMKRAHIGEFEELVLLTVGILFRDAYGLAILDELEKQTDREFLMSAVHKTLVRLEDKGFLRSFLGGATAERGGRDKRLYLLTESGTKVLALSRERRNAMWKQISKPALAGGK